MLEDKYFILFQFENNSESFFGSRQVVVFKEKCKVHFYWTPGRCAAMNDIIHM
jgi:hypothetical protein